MGLHAVVLISVLVGAILGAGITFVSASVGFIDLSVLGKGSSGSCPLSCATNPSSWMCPTSCQSKVVTVTMTNSPYTTKVLPAPYQPTYITWVGTLKIKVGSVGVMSGNSAPVAPTGSYYPSTTMFFFIYGSTTYPLHFTFPIATTFTDGMRVQITGLLYAPSGMQPWIVVYQMTPPVSAA